MTVRRKATPKPTPPRLAYSPEEAARALGISRAMIYRMMGDGRLPSFHIGRAHRIRASDIDNLMEHGG